MNRIMKREVGQAYSTRREATLTGTRLFMSDGSVWFHPNNGDEPIREM